MCTYFKFNIIKSIIYFQYNSVKMTSFSFYLPFSLIQLVSCSSQPLVSFCPFIVCFYYFIKLSLNNGRHPELIKRFSIETHGKSRFGQRMWFGNELSSLAEVSLCVYIYIYIYIYTHTHTHTIYDSTGNVEHSGIFSKYFMPTKAGIKMFSFITIHFYFLDYSRLTNSLMIGTHL